MITGLAVTSIGLILSAFFSGSETGFYRVARVRLLMDAKSGNRIATALLWLVARPSLIVATVLIGNNIANYLVSFGLLLLSQHAFANWPENIQAAIPVAATPLLFIYGELLPKYLYYHAPYRLSSWGAPFMVACAVAFLPLSLLVIALENIWQRFTMHDNVHEKLSLERQHLQRVLLESEEAGILLPIQRELAQNIFTYGGRPIRQFAAPLRGLPMVAEAAARETILQQARRHQQPLVAVTDKNGNVIGCHLVADVVVLEPTQTAPLRPVVTLKPSATTLETITMLQAQQAPLALIDGSHGKPVGFITLERLTDLLLPNA
ncbi:MAG: hemolysin protein [Pirellulaceae bacterium]|nr:MAG: hemolysin protein [Pirellulaceae bacterium]